ncbi:MAG: cupin domain-containing protein [Deltaproteobacteria bacterium]
MDTSAFEAALKADGFGEIETKSVAPNIVNSAHAHPFAVRFLVLSGEITVSANGAARTCRTGDTFSMDAGCEHVERLGPEGVTYLVGRKR